MGDVAYKMIDILFFLWFFILFEDERFGATKTVVDFADLVGIGKDEAAIFAGEGFGKLMVLF